MAVLVPSPGRQKREQEQLPHPTLSPASPLTMHFLLSSIKLVFVVVVVYSTKHFVRNQIFNNNNNKKACLLCLQGEPATVNSFFFFLIIILVNMQSNGFHCAKFMDICCSQLFPPAILPHPIPSFLLVSSTLPNNSPSVFTLHIIHDSLVFLFPLPLDLSPLPYYPVYFGYVMSSYYIFI